MSKFYHYVFSIFLFLNTWMYPVNSFAQSNNCQTKIETIVSTIDHTSPIIKWISVNPNIQRLNAKIKSQSHTPDELEIIIIKSLKRALTLLKRANSSHSSFFPDEMKKIFIPDLYLYVKRHDFIYALLPSLAQTTDSNRLIYSNNNIKNIINNNSKILELQNLIYHEFFNLRPSLQKKSLQLFTTLRDLPFISKSQFVIIPAIILLLSYVPHFQIFKESDLTSITFASAFSILGFALYLTKTIFKTLSSEKLDMAEKFPMTIFFYLFVMVVGLSIRYATLPHEKQNVQIELNQIFLSLKTKTERLDELGSLENDTYLYTKEEFLSLEHDLDAIALTLEELRLQYLKESEHFYFSNKKLKKSLKNLSKELEKFELKLETILKINKNNSF